MVKNNVGIFCLIFCISLECMQPKERKKPKDYTYYESAQVGLAVAHQKELLDKKFEEAHAKSDEELKKHMSSNDAWCSLF